MGSTLIISPFKGLRRVGLVRRRIINHETVALEDSADPTESSGAGMSS